MQQMDPDQANELVVTAAEVMAAGLTDARHEQWIELRAERIAIAPAVDAEDARREARTAHQLLDFPSHRHFVRRVLAQQIERRDFEIDRAIEPDQHREAHAA